MTMFTNQKKSLKLEIDAILCKCSLYGNNSIITSNKFSIYMPIATIRKHLSILTKCYFQMLLRHIFLIFSFTLFSSFVLFCFVVLLLFFCLIYFERCYFKSSSFLPFLKVQIFMNTIFGKAGKKSKDLKL